jgi:hypothetical protein
MPFHTMREEPAELRNTLNYFKRDHPTARCAKVSVVTEKNIYIRYERPDLNARGLLVISRQRTRRLQTPFHAGIRTGPRWAS